MHDADCGDERGNISELGNGGSEDGCERPVERYDDNPDKFSFLTVKFWATEEIFDNVLVDNFDTDVAIQNSGNETTDKQQRVGYCLPGIRGETLVCRVVGELALFGVNDKTKHEVAEKNEDFGYELGLDEVEGSFHFGHEFTV